MYRLLVVVFFLPLLPYCEAMAQNLVPNESFEKFLVCPKRIDHVRQLYIADWQQATAGSVDYFHACSATCGTPHNAAGTQRPKTGEAYVGIYCLKGDYREYIQVKLKQPLTPGTKYYIEFSASLAEVSGLAINRLGAVISAAKLNSRAEGILDCIGVEVIDGEQKTVKKVCGQQAANNPAHMMTEKRQWFTISGIFVATGGEQYITIGNFHSNKETETEVVALDKDRAAYYFIDDVIVAEGTQPVPIVFTPRDGKIEKHEVPGEKLVASKDNNSEENKGSSTKPSIKDVKENQPVSADDYFELASTSGTKSLPKEPIVLDNIFFAPNDYAILPKSQGELLKLVGFMQENPQVRIEIGGHTDDTGTAEFNQELSENRAKAVFNFLVMEEIDAGRLSYKGYGNSKQLSSAQGQNRRVEFKIVGY